MNEKHVRYGLQIFTLDRISQGIHKFMFDKFDLKNIIEEANNHYGLKLISDKEEIHIIMEYSNMIWDYRVYFGSYKKHFKQLEEDDARWNYIEKGIEEDLKIMGLDDLKEEVLTSLKQKKYFEYKNKSDMQFKKYFIKN